MLKVQVLKQIYLKAMIGRKKLANGLEVLTVPVSGTKAITIMILFPVGSRFEDEKLAGASHFVEHMMFKGTKKRPTYLEISRELDAVGAEYNAFTSKDYTGYYIKIDSRQQELGFDVLSDMVFNSSFDEEEVKKEKGVIVEELRMYEDNPIMDIDSVYESIVFPNHPLGRDVGGTTQTVKAISRDRLFDYYKKYYRPDNMILVLAGNIDQKNKDKFIKKYFGVEKNKKNIGAVKFYKKFKFDKSEIPLEKRIKIKTKKIDQAHVMMGFPGLNYTDKKRYAMSVLLAVLSGGMSSRLFVEVREKRGLAYMIRASVSPYVDTGTVYVQAGLDPVRLPEALRVIKSELEKIATTEVAPKELKDAKNNLIGRLTLSLEDSSEQASWYAKKFLFNKKIETPEQVITEIKKVSASDVKKLAQQLFDFKQMRVAVISQMKRDQILKILSQF